MKRTLLQTAKSIFVPLIFSLFLSACGFHWRGTIQLPPCFNKLAIISTDHDPQLISLLESQLIRNAIQINPEPRGASYWLMIKKINVQEQIVSVGSSTNPRQYNLILHVEFMLKTPKGQTIKGPTKINVIRQLTVNNDRILGSNAEEAILINEMKQEMVMQIINQLSHQQKLRLACTSNSKYLLSS